MGNQYQGEATLTTIEVVEAAAGEEEADQAEEVGVGLDVGVEGTGEEEGGAALRAKGGILGGFVQLRRKSLGSRRGAYFTTSMTSGYGSHHDFRIFAGCAPQMAA